MRVVSTHTYYWNLPFNDNNFELQVSCPPEVAEWLDKRIGQEDQTAGDPQVKKITDNILALQSDRIPEEELELSRAVERDLRERLSEPEDIIEQMALSTNTFEVMRLVDTAWQRILDRQEQPQ